MIEVLDREFVQTLEEVRKEFLGKRFVVDMLDMDYELCRVYAICDPGESLHIQYAELGERGSTPYVGSAIPRRGHIMYGTRYREEV